MTGYFRRFFIEIILSVLHIRVDFQITWLVFYWQSFDPRFFPGCRLRFLVHNIAIRLFLREFVRIRFELSKEIPLFSAPPGVQMIQHLVFPLHRIRINKIIGISVGVVDRWVVRRVFPHSVDNIFVFINSWR